MKVGDRVEYTGPHPLWRGHTGEIRAEIDLGDQVIYRVAWDDPMPPEPGAGIGCFIMPYNRKQWAVLP